jgi:hypothetical protein
MTAEELIDSKYVDFHSLDNGNIWENIENLMITFAKQEVEKALKAASGNARMYSEKDMKMCWDAASSYTIGSHIDFKQTHPDFKEWFEKFKNK